MIGIPMNDLVACENDILYLVQDIPDWQKKEYLKPSILSHLTDSCGAFRYNPEVARAAFDELVKGVEKK